MNRLFSKTSFNSLMSNRSLQSFPEDTFKVTRLRTYYASLYTFLPDSSPKGFLTLYRLHFLDSPVYSNHQRFGPSSRHSGLSFNLSPSFLNPFSFPCLMYLRRSGLNFTVQTDFFSFQYTVLYNSYTSFETYYQCFLRYTIWNRKFIIYIYIHYTYIHIYVYLITITVVVVCYLFQNILCVFFRSRHCEGVNMKSFCR